MSRLMSCALTIPAVMNCSKTVTRRAEESWKTLKPGDRLTLVEKGMGIPKGGKVVRLDEVEIVDIRVESLGRMLEDPKEFTREGFPYLDTYESNTTQRLEWFMWWAGSHGWKPSPLAPLWVRQGRLHRPVTSVKCRRIEWRYLDVVAA